MRRSLPLLLAELLGYNLSLLIIGGVLGTIGVETHVVRVLLSLAAGAYLLTVAAKLWGRRIMVTGSKPVSWLQVFVTTLLNPKVLIFLLIIPFSAPNARSYLVAFSALVASVGASWILIGVLSNRVLPTTITVLIPRVSSVAIVCLALVLIGSQWIS